MEVVGSWSEVTARKTAEQAALQASEQRLTDAIESISEGFSLYDAQDRLVLGNYKYKELFDHGEGPPKPGMTYEEILRTVVESGLIQDARSRPEAWLEERLAHITTPLTLSVIGCVVNGPGEARETDIGFTGGGNNMHQVYVSGIADHRLKDSDIVDHLVELVEKKAAQLEAAKRAETEATLAAAK